MTDEPEFPQVPENFEPEPNPIAELVASDEYQSMKAQIETLYAEHYAAAVPSAQHNMQNL